jgi:hypothetical protein
MNENAIVSEGGIMAETNRYSLAGWLAIAQAVLFPLAIGISIFQTAIGARFFGYRGPVLGPSDMLMLVFTAFGVYTLLMFKRLLNERYNFNAIDVLIIISIWWAVIFQVGSLFIKSALIFLGPVSKAAYTITQGAFLVSFMVFIGVIDIIIGVRFLKEKEKFSNLVLAYAYITLVAGILEITIIGIPISMLLIPALCIILGLIFLRDEREVEFV